MTRALRRDDKGFPWLAWLVMASMLVIGAALGHAQTTTDGAGTHGPAPAPAPLAPKDSKGFTATAPRATPGQTLVPPARHGTGGVIDPPTALDPGMAKAMPPAQVFPTPVIKPAPGDPPPR